MSLFLKQYNIIVERFRFFSYWDYSISEVFFNFQLKIVMLNFHIINCENGELLFFSFWNFNVNPILSSAVHGGLLLLFLAYALRQIVSNVTHLKKKLKQQT